MSRRVNDMYNNSLKMDFIWNTLGSTFISFTSLILMIIVTRINGIESAGIFTFSFSSATILNIVALYCGRTYQVTDDNKYVSESSYLYTRIFTSIVAFLISLIFCLINDYSFNKFAIFLALCFYKCLEATIDFFYGVLQKNGKLYIAGRSMTFRSILIISSFLCVDLYTKNLLLSCLVLIGVSIIYLFVFDFKSSKPYLHLSRKINKKEIFYLLKKASYTCFFSLIAMLIINIPKYLIDFFLTEEIQAIYGIISMPATFIMLFGQFILQPSLVGMGESYLKNDKYSFNRSVINISSVILTSLVIIVPVAYIFGIPILSIIYGVNLEAYTIHLIIIIIGAAFYTISQILLNALIALRCTKEQFVVQSLLLIVSIFIALFFVSKYNISGSIISYFLIMIVQFIAYIILYKIILNYKFK